MTWSMLDDAGGSPVRPGVCLYGSGAPLPFFLCNAPSVSVILLHDNNGISSWLLLPCCYKFGSAMSWHPHDWCMAHHVEPLRTITKVLPIAVCHLPILQEPENVSGACVAKEEAVVQGITAMWSRPWTAIGKAATLGHGLGQVSSQTLCVQGF